VALKYRLNILGWYNFENLVATLLKVIIGPGVTSFGGTKDGGRDASFEGTAPFPSEHSNWRGEWVFQVKYSESEALESGSQAGRILRTLGNEMKRILEETEPDNYVLITSFRMPTSVRTELPKVARKAGFRGNFHSIDGREVCEFLDIHPQLRRSFPQLLGLADVEQVLNKDLYNRSQAFVAFWQPRLATFVAVNQYFEALETIRNHNFVVIDGPPEVGKSFIGAAMTLVYAAEGYEIFFVQNPQEIFRLYDPSRKQLYFADDAVGTISFDPELGSYWSRELPGILRKLSPQHKLIWTARSYILREAIASTKLREHIDDFRELERILKTALVLLPKKGDVRIDPRDVDLKAFRTTPSGRVLGEIVTAVCSQESYRSKTEYSLANWLSIVGNVYELSAYALPAPKPSYLYDLVKQSAKFTFPETVSLYRFLWQNEHLLFKQAFTPQLDRTWCSLLTQRAHECCLAYEEIPVILDDDNVGDYEAWNREAESVLEIANQYFEFSSFQEPEDVMHLEDSLNTATRMVDEYLHTNEPDYLDEAYEAEDWTIEEIFADL